MVSAVGLAIVALIPALSACEGRGSGLTGLSRYPGGTTEPENPSGASVEVVNFAFVPAVVRIREDAAVLWTWNSDSLSHNVTFSDPTRSSSDMRSGTHRVVFPERGEFAYRCTIHVGMNGAVIVQ
jgi:plastocyanin